MHTSWISRIPWNRTGILGKSVLPVFFFVFAVATAARADDVSVDCPSGTPYGSIQSALEALPLSGPHTITVTGTCAENVLIADRNLITIQAGDQTAAISPGSGPALRVMNSHGIVLQGLSITNGRPAGVQVGQNSYVRVRNCTIENNRQGILVADDSTLVISESAVRGSGWNAITVSQSMISIEEGVTLESNQGSGLRLEGSRARITASELPNVFQNNGQAGVLVNWASQATFEGINTIRNNSAMGVQVFSSSSAFFNGYVEEGVDYATTIQSNAGGGITVVHSSSAGIVAPTKILGNGGNNDPTTRNAGIYVSGGSSLLMLDDELSPTIQVKDNVGPGILADGSGTMELFDTVATGNSGGGLVLEHMSAARGYSGNIISGATCDSTSLLYGNVIGISPLNCKNTDVPKVK